MTPEKATEYQRSTEMHTSSLSNLHQLRRWKWCTGVEVCEVTFATSEQANSSGVSLIFRT